jgi:PAS domain S-box-containing protein
MADHLHNPKPATPPSKPKRRKARGEGESAAVKNDDYGSAADNVAEASIIPVIGIGASAGGIEALSRFFEAMSPNSGAAFVIVLHLDPTRESQMANVLSSHTNMPVVQGEDGVRLTRDHVYVIAPDYYLSVRESALHISVPEEPRGQRHPIDVLFSSLASDQRERAIAIILSGTGTDGTQGAKEIKAEGGLVLVQDPNTAKFDGMPRSAIVADIVDIIVAPEKMPEVLQRYLCHDYIAAPHKIEDPAQQGQATSDLVLEVLRARGYDFRGYKRNTLSRRIHRRLGLRNIGTLAEYVDDLRADPDEVSALAKDLMISVTGFFRDPEAWKALVELSIAPLVANRETDAPLRIWIPCCATGEEAYSVAMLVIEQAEAAGKQLELKIFATDTQEDNLNKARDGVYPGAAVAGLGSGRRGRFFGQLDGFYQVKKELRNLITFARQNLMREPPFSRMDLISCRNLLIYLDPEAQERIIALCHFALREGGHLFLGSAETIGRHDDLFEPVSKKWRIYRRLGPTRHDIVNFPLLPGPARPPKAQDTQALREAPDEPAVRAIDAARRTLLERYAPAATLIDHKFRVLYFHGPTGDYLEQPTGEPTRDLLAMAREGLAAGLRSAVREAISEKRDVTVGAHIGHGQSARPVVIKVMPVRGGYSQDGGHVLVSFEPGETGQLPKAAVTLPPEKDDALSGNRAWQEDLQAVRAELQSTIERMEAANEELKASNEEVTSMNEELQSTNEELETSKEELQSFNEELHTVNNQLQHKIRELEDTTNDLNNLLAGTDTATLFLDMNLCIKWFAPKTKELFSLLSTDVGRPIADFSRKFADENLLPDAEIVLKTLSPIEAEVSSEVGRWYMRRMLPYRTQDNRIAGVVVSFTDITDRKRAADLVNEARVYAEGIVQTGRQPLLVLDQDLRVRSANPAFYELFRVAPAKTEGELIYELGNGQWNIPRLRTLLDQVLSEGQSFSDVEIEHEFLDIGLRCMLLNARKLSREGDRAALILLAIEDITDQRKTDQHRRWLTSVINSSSDAIVSKDLNGIVTSWNKGAEKLFGYTAEEMIGRPIVTLIPRDRLNEEPVILERIARGKSIDEYETLRQRKDGSQVWVSLAVSPVINTEGRIVGASKIARDITERRHAEAQRTVLVGELNHRVKNTLATVHAIAAQTLSNSKSIKEGRSAFEARLMALSRAHDLLTQESWEGADLNNVVRKAIEPLDARQGRFHIEGPNVRLAPSAALSFAMALHELATNATKYGALSNEQGHVSVTWQFKGGGEERRLHMRWTEQGGPPVVAPSRKGFGSLLVGRALPQELGGKVQIDYRSSGLVCMIDAPIPIGP